MSKVYHNGMDKVTLKDAYLVNAESKDVEYLLSMNSNKFLYEFYKVAGLEPLTAEGYAGWERSDDLNFRGHFFGHYMSALSQAYLGCKDADTKAKLLKEIKDAVIGLEACQKAYAVTYPESAGFISAFPEGALQRVDGVASPTPDDERLIVPYYNLHKVVAGLTDIAKNVTDDAISEKALCVAEGFGEYIYNRMLKLTNKDHMLYTEYGGMNEALYELYNLTGNVHMKVAAEHFDEVYLFRELAEDRDVLSGRHANTTIPKFIGAAKRYQLLSDERFYGELSLIEREDLQMYLTAAKSFWDIVTSSHSYITGGNSQSEHFHDANTQARYTGNTNCETCNTYNMLKLSRILFQLTGDKKYMDYYENTYINAILSSQNPQTGMMMYFQPMEAGYFKVYNTPYEDFWCCTGTGVENFTKLGDTIYLAMEDALYVNMYFASEYNNGSIAFTTEANLPNSDVVKITIRENQADETLKLRIPDWVAGPVALKVNDAMVDVVAEAERGYIKLAGLSAGDVLELTLPMALTAYNLPDNEDMLAFKYGPVVLSCALGSKDLDKEQGAGILVRAPQLDKEVNNIVMLEGDTTAAEWKANLAQNMVRIEDSADGQIQFQLKGTDRSELIYSPHYRQHKERYGLYMLFAYKDSPILKRMLLDKLHDEKIKEACSDEILVFDNNNSELSHNLQTSGYNVVGCYNGRTYRDGGRNADEWFSYDLKIAEGVQEQYLSTTYNPEDSGRSFDVFINDELFATEHLTNQGITLTADRFYTVCRQIPEHFLIGDGVKKDAKGNPIITVRFQGNGTSITGGLFGVRVHVAYSLED